MDDAPSPPLLTHTFAFDGGRSVSVFVPEQTPEAIVYAGDGQLIAPWGASLTAMNLPPTMAIGVHRTSSPDEMIRLGEYSPAIDPDRYAAHEAFIIDTVMAWVQTDLSVALPPERTAVCGVSAGAELALSLGVRHPERFGVVFAMSPGGGFRPPANLASARRLHSVYLTAGTREPFFLENACRWADALQAAGAEVKLTERDGDHGDPFWAEEFPRMVAWAFDR